jgi:P2 family phage contractile tail tube protein
MANLPLVLEAANLFCGDDPSGSNHLVLQELKLPTLEETYVDHAAGGADIAIEVDVQTARLEASFVLAGWQPTIVTWFALPAGQMTFTAYGMLRDRLSGDPVEAIAVMRGRLGRVTPGPYHKAELQGHEYAIRAVTYYELTIDDQQIAFFDFFSPPRRLRTIRGGNVRAGFYKTMTSER